MTKHPSHKTRSSDASTYDEVCVNCGETDVVPGGWGKLAEPCPGVSPPENEHIATLVLTRRPDGGFRVTSPDLPGLVVSALDLDDVSRAVFPAALSLSMRKNRKTS